MGQFESVEVGEGIGGNEDKIHSFPCFRRMIEWFTSRYQTSLSVINTKITYLHLICFLLSVNYSLSRSSCSCEYQTFKRLMYAHFWLLISHLDALSLKGHLLCSPKNLLLDIGLNILFKDVI